MNTTNASFEELETILSREYDAHAELLDAAMQVNAAVKESDLETLRLRTAHLDEKVSKIAEIEEQRTACCGTARLAAIIGQAPPYLREKLYNLQTSLKAMLHKISRVNVANRVLIEEGLQLVQGTLALTMQPGVRFAHYRERGNRATAALPFHPFINRTV
jgi:phage I-like protein